MKINNFHDHLRATDWLKTCTRNVKLSASLAYDSIRGFTFRVRKWVSGELFIIICRLLLFGVTSAHMYFTLSCLLIDILF